MRIKSNGVTYLTPQGTQLSKNINGNLTVWNMSANPPRPLITFPPGAVVEVIDDADGLEGMSAFLLEKLRARPALGYRFAGTISRLKRLLNTDYNASKGVWKS